MVSRMKIYYPRMQFAQKIINYFSGDFYSFMLFEARRMGKTSFLKNDLIPLANIIISSIFPLCIRMGMLFNLLRNS